MYFVVNTSYNTSKRPRWYCYTMADPPKLMSLNKGVKTFDFQTLVPKYPNQGNLRSEEPNVYRRKRSPKDTRRETHTDTRLVEKNTLAVSITQSRVGLQE